MNLKSIALQALSLLMLFGLTGCAKYRATSLKSLTVRSQTKKSSISFSHKVFSASDCRRYLGRNVIRKRYQPIQITFTNNTDQYFTLSKHSLSFDCVSTKEVAKSVRFNTVGRVVGYSILGIFLWPFIIPAIVDGIGSAKANKEIEADFTAKALSKMVVEPHSKVSGIVFIPADADLDENFTLTVSDLEHKPYTLSVESPEMIIVK